jgi:flagellar protein FlaF
MQNQAALAYNQTAQITVAPRELEADLLLKAAVRLQAVKDNWPSEKSEINAALTYNRRLWTVFATSVAGDENPLPKPIKQNIANLGLFIFNHTIATMSDPAAEKLGTLITINREIAAGLRGQ